MGGQLRISLLVVVRLPTLWRRVDVSGNRLRHPVDTVAAKDQQEGLHPLTAPDCQYEENNRPNDGETSAIGPIVSEAKHLLPPVPFEGHHVQLLVCRDLDGGKSHPDLKCPFFNLGATLLILSAIAICYIEYSTSQ